MRFLFRPPAEHAAGLLSLPWHEPLEEWTDDRLLEVAHRGISRHVVRFVEADGHVYALKEIDERLARREYRLLGRLAEMGMPAVSALGICVERPPATDSRTTFPRTRYSSPGSWTTRCPTGTCSPTATRSARPTS